MPDRIICLSAEAADICSRLGEWDRVVAVSAFASQAGLDPEPVIGGFSPGDCARVLALAPDLGQVHALASAIVLQPGPRLLAGARVIRAIIEAWRALTPPSRGTTPRSGGTPPRTS